jgi:hypothetical protein
MFVCLFWCDHVGGLPTPLLVSLESFNWGGLDISCFIICKLSENTFFMIGSIKTLKLIPVWPEYYSDGWPQGRFNIPWHRGSLVKMIFSSLACSQIWLNLPIDDCHFDCITKLTKKKSIAPQQTLQVSPKRSLLYTIVTFFRLKKILIWICS